MTTTTTMITETTQPRPDSTSSSDGDSVEDLPRTLKRSSTIHNPSPGFSHRHKHSKKLSLSFPIHVSFPCNSPLTGSHTSLSSSAASPNRNRTPTSAVMPIPSPEELLETADGPDFLSLIAGQERKVMELREDLQKAESQLLGLKRQWATFEAKKKHAELRNKTVKMQNVSSRSAKTEEDEAERAKRREVKERKLKELADREVAGHERSDSNGNNGKRKVLAGRHTRTLSLLQNQAHVDSAHTGGRRKNRTESSASTTQQPGSARSDIGHQDQENRAGHRPSLSRQPTLQDLIASGATGAAQLNFGKTYKDLAQAGRKSLPPGTDVLVKQGKQVYDGINQGFWTFVEDIRQATVGDEPVNGMTPEQQLRDVRRKKSKQKLANKDNTHGEDAKAREIGQNGDQNKPEKDSFWQEFGVETPRKNRGHGQNGNKTSTIRSKKANSSSTSDHESKSSTDSKCPPSLLADLMDVNEDDEAWDNWPVESPASQRKQGAVKVRDARENDDTDDEEEVAEVVVGRQEFSSTRKARTTPLDGTWAELTS